jgi:hypothetical protein
VEQQLQPRPVRLPLGPVAVDFAPLSQFASARSRWSSSALSPELKSDTVKFAFRIGVRF